MVLKKKWSSQKIIKMRCVNKALSFLPYDRTSLNQNTSYNNLITYDDSEAIQHRLFVVELMLIPKDLDVINHAR